MHRRTLNRRLEAQGTTFQKVLDEVRLEAARQLLDVTKLPLTEIAAPPGLCGAERIQPSVPALVRRGAVSQAIVGRTKLKR